MKTEKMNLPLAAGSLLSLILYLFAPVVSVIMFGFRGQLLMKVETLFVIPVLLIALCLILSLVPLGKVSSYCGIGTAVVLLIIGLLSGDIISDKLNQLVALAGFDLENVLTTTASILIRMGWGMLFAMLLMLACSLIGLFLPSGETVTSGRTRQSGTGRANTNSNGTRTSNTNGSARNSTNRNIYRF